MSVKIINHDPTIWDTPVVGSLNWKKSTMVMYFWQVVRPLEEGKEEKLYFDDVFHRSGNVSQKGEKEEKATLVMYFLQGLRSFARVKDEETATLAMYFLQVVRSLKREWDDLYCLFGRSDFLAISTKILRFRLGFDREISFFFPRIKSNNLSQILDFPSLRH